MVCAKSSMACHFPVLESRVRFCRTELGIALSWTWGGVIFFLSRLFPATELSPSLSLAWLSSKSGGLDLYLGPGTLYRFTLVCHLRIRSIVQKTGGGNFIQIVLLFGKEHGYVRHREKL